MISLVSSKIGRWLLGALALLLGIGVALLKAFRAGRQAERMERQKQTIKAVRERKKVDEEIDRLSAAERRRRLSDRWGR